MKKKLAKVIAMALVCAMTLPSVVYASTATAPSLSTNYSMSSNSSDSTISGNGVVDTATYNVILPSRLDFAVDKFEVADEGQIYGEDYPVINASPMAVRIDVSVSADNVASTNFVSTSDNAALTSENERAVYLAAYVPQDFTLSSLSVSVGAVSSDIIASANYTLSDNVVFPVTSENKAEFSFKLDRLVSENMVSANIASANVATFTWTGHVNDNIEWKTGDIKVKATFHMKGMAQGPYNALESTSSNNLVTGGGGSSSIPSATVIQGVTATPIVFIVPEGKTIRQPNEAIVCTKESGGTQNLGAAGYTVTGGNTLTIPTSAGPFTSSWSKTTYTVPIPLTDGSTYNVKIIVQ